ncbi:hypothetical protein [Tenacibaculum xiamenense]|uniref:hypothetical protein n=1 Tax=Tenacibaculum xiamenense TaxID=1261553 RepID=UPI00389300AC
MKKIVYTLLVIIIIVFTVGYFRYNPTVNFVNTIPKTAKKVVRVNLRELEYIVLKEYVFNPSLIFQSKEREAGKEKRVSLFKQIEIPSNLFLYSFSDDLNDAWYSSEVAIKDYDELKLYFKEQNLPENVYKNILYFRKKNLIYTVVENKLVFVFTQEKDEKLVLEKLVNQKDYLSKNDALITFIEDNNALVLGGTTEGDFLKLTKEESTLNLTGKWWKFENLLLPEMFKASEKSIASLYGKINAKEVIGLVSEEQKKKLKKIATIELDSIEKYWDGELRAQVLDVKVKQDTIVSYDYDDDFNKIEKKEIKEKKVPVSKIYLGGGAFYSYLKRKSFIKNVEDSEVLTLNPFFKTEVKSFDDGVLMFSGGDDNLGVFQKNTLPETKFILKVNFESFGKRFYFKNSLLKNLKKGSLQIEMDNHFTLNLFFSKAPINSILSGGLF